MLDDTPRKLLRIMYHFSCHFHRMPTLPELERMSGRVPADIRSGLRELVNNHYIEWDPQKGVETALIIEDWERPSPAEKTSLQRSQEPQRSSYVGNIDYWTHY